MADEDSFGFASELLNICGLGSFTCSSSDRSQTPLSDIDDNALIQDDENISRESFVNPTNTANVGDRDDSISQSRSFDVEGSKFDSIPRFIVLLPDEDKLAECEPPEDFAERHFASLSRMSLDEIKTYERSLTRELIITQSEEIAALHNLIERELILWRTKLAGLRDRDGDEAPSSLK